VTISNDLSPSEGDEDLSRRVALFLEQRRLLSGMRLVIKASRGIVTLCGTSPTFHQRQLIVAATRRVAGTIQIVDALKVDPPQAIRPTTRIAAGNLAILACTLVLALGLLLTGCGRSGPPRVATHQAKGSATWQGRPLAGAFVALHPKNQIEPGAPTPTATVQPDGTFALTTYDAGDGVPEGEYVVTLQWRKTVKSGSEYVLGPNLLPVKYARPDTSDIVVRIAANQTELPPIALKR